MTDEPMIDPALNDPPEEPVALFEALLAAVNTLSGNVVSLSNRLDVNARQAKINRALTIGLVIVYVISIGVGGFLYLQISGQVESNTSNAVQACENANSQRAANLSLWQFVLNQSKIRTEHDQQVHDAFAGWITDLYAPHDCDNLGKVYKIPDPPVIE